MNHLMAAAAAISLLVAPAVASATSSQSREPVSVAVSTTGLDLNRPEQVDALRARIARSIAVACNPGDRIGADMKPDWKCRREMGANAEIALNRALNNAAQNRVASN